MPGCCAYGCTNSRAKGFKVYRLPFGKGDDERLKKWILNIKRANFNPSKYTVICEAHFERDQFEPKIPGKLKKNALPTIFSYNEKPKLRRKPLVFSLGDKTTADDLISSDETKKHSAANEHSYSSKQTLSFENEQDTTVHEEPFCDNAQNASNRNKIPGATEQASSTYNVLIREVAPTYNVLPGQAAPTFVLPRQVTPTYNVHPYQVKPTVAAATPGSGAPVYLYLTNNQNTSPTTLYGYNSSKPTNQRSTLNELELECVRKKLKETELKLIRSQRQKRKLQRENYNLSNNLSKLFTPDQIAALSCKRGVSTHWSEETIKVALKLKNACGVNGYKELYNQGYPLPSLRTLRRRLQLVSESCGVTSDVVENSYLDENEENCENEIKDCENKEEVCENEAEDYEYKDQFCENELVAFEIEIENCENKEEICLVEQEDCEIEAKDC